MNTREWGKRHTVTRSVLNSGLHVVAEEAVDVVNELLVEVDFGKLLYLPFSKVLLLLLQTGLTVTFLHVLL